MPFTRRGRLRQALSRPFPPEWRDLLDARMAHWRLFDAGERAAIEDLIRILLVDKFWEATNGFALTDEMRVLIAAMASVPILGLDYDYYHRVTSIIVAPTTVVMHGNRPVGDGLWSDEPERIIGLSPDDGPVLIAWDAARVQARHPERGQNVVYHEFAHKLDLLEGDIDGTPPLETPEQWQRWVAVCTAEYERLRDGTSGDLIDPYGAEDTGEFFAVVTEVFFNRPVEMEAEKTDLYTVLRDFYQQDPAARVRRGPQAS